MKKITATIFIISLTAAGTAMSGDSSINDLWESLDSNKDEYVSIEEAKSSTAVSNQWSTLDANQDQKLSSKEFSSLDLTK